MPEFSLALACANEMDRRDPLAHLRDRFIVPPDGIDLMGNSLGLPARTARTAVLTTLSDWEQRGVTGWTQGDRPWLHTAERLGEQMAPLVGAAADAVVATGTTTANLHAAVATFFRPGGRRTKILAAAAEFPSDIYALKSQLALHGLDPAQHLVLVGEPDGGPVAHGAIAAALRRSDIALAVLPVVLFRSAQVLDVPGLTAAAHENGICIGWDACHAVGVLPLHLDAWNVDFAVWCGYKYLCGGPGAPAALYVHPRHFGRQPGLTGWFGNRRDTQFALHLDFDPAPGAGAWQLSAPGMLSAAPLAASLPLLAEAGIARLRHKSLQLTAYLQVLADNWLLPLGFSVATPRDNANRGGHVALRHPQANRIGSALLAQGITSDVRPPDLIRLAPAPPYTRFADIWQALTRMRALGDSPSAD